MLTTFRHSFKTFVQAKNNDMPLGFLVDMVVNPNTGVFEAFWIKTLEGHKLLLPKDILFWDADQVTIGDTNDLAEPGSLPRLDKVFDQECSILKAPVFDQKTKQNIGIVCDFTFDTLSPRLLALEIKNGLLGLKRQRLPQHCIVKIESHRITVNSTALKNQRETTAAKKEVPVLKVPEFDRSSRKEE